MPSPRPTFPNLEQNIAFLIPFIPESIPSIIHRRNLSQFLIPEAALNNAPQIPFPFLRRNFFPSQFQDKLILSTRSSQQKSVQAIARTSAQTALADHATFGNCN